MLRLIERGLMYGNLIRVDTKTLRDRYNSALKALTDRTTALESFHVDISGYSPEIGDELGDHDYLNPNGCNRQFILLTLEQEACPLIGAHFSFSRSILCDFIADNRQELFALSARDAVIGELENSTFQIDDLSDIVTIRRIRVSVNTPRGLVAAAIELERRIEAFEASETAWWSDHELGGLIELAERVGDIRRHPVSPRVVDYTQGNFFTSHFGGLYVFRDVDTPALISCDPSFEPGDTGGLAHIPLADGAAVGAFLERNHLVEDVTRIDDLDGRGLLRQRMDFILVDHLCGLEGHPDQARLRPDDLKRLVHRYLDALPDEFHLITEALRALEQGVDPPSVATGDPGYFYLMRSAGHGDRDLVNHLIARLTPLDIRQLYICNKDVFYATYRGWSDTKRDYVTVFLSQHYVSDKDSVWQALYDASAPQIRGPWGPKPESA